MSGLPPVSPRLADLHSDDLSALVDDRALSRGRSLFTNGSVSGARAQHNQLMARVRDRATRAYQVTVSVNEANAFAICTCYQGGVCEHAAATLVAWTAHRDQFAWTPPDKQEAPLPLPQADALWHGTRGANRRVGTLLALQRVGDVRKLAQRVGLDVDEGEAKDVLARRLGPVLADSGRVATALADASPDQQRALHALTFYDRPVSPGEIERVAGAAEVALDPSDNALKGLVGLGLAFNATPSTSAGPGWQIPLEWAALMPAGPLPLALPSQHTLHRTKGELAFVTALRALCLVIEGDPPPARRPDPRSPFELQNAVLTTWFNLPDEIERLGKRGYSAFGSEPIWLTMAAPPLPVSDATADALAVNVDQPFAVVALMLRLLDHLRLLNIRDTTCYLDPRSRLLWERSAIDQARLLASTWAITLQWSEFHDVPGVRLRRHMQGSYAARPQHVYAELAALRRAVVRAVRTLDPATSFDIASLLDRLRRIGPRLVFPELANGQGRIWQLCDRHGGVLDIQQPSDWQLGVVPFVQQVLRQMDMLGLVTTDAAVSAARITDLGAYLLGLHADYVPQPSGQVLHIADDLSIQVAAVDADASLLEQLDRVAEREGFGAGRFRYRITARTVRDALVAGHDPDAIVGLLQRHSSAPLLAAHQEQLAAWVQHFGSTHIYGGVALLELADDLLLPELLRTTSLGAALVTQLSPRLLVIDPARSTVLWNELVAKGYTPQRVRAVTASDSQ